MNCMKFVLPLVSLLWFAPSSLAQPSSQSQPKRANRKAVKLRPSDDYWSGIVGHAAVHFTRLSNGKKLASVGDKLYMLDARGRELWSWSSFGPPLTDKPVVDSSGTIYVIGYDLLWAAIDSATGKEKWRGTASGRAVYSQIKLYRGDKYLVVTDMSGYRDGRIGPTINNKLTLCKGNDILWQTEIPAGTTILVKGVKIFAATRRKNRTIIREVRLPKNLTRPIGKVSMTAK
jgi:hypothetical protein